MKYVYACKAKNREDCPDQRLLSFMRTDTQELNKFCETWDCPHLKQVFGYSSHGGWSSLGRIRELELGRGNRFPELEYPDETPAIWVCKTPREALRYLLPADEWETLSKRVILPISIRERMMEIGEIPLLRSDVIAHEDPDEGYLLLRVKTVE